MYKRKMNPQSVILLLLLLALLPIGSYLFLKRGYEYQVKARAELGNLGKLPSFEDTTYFGDTLVGTDMGPQLVLAAYFDPADGDFQQFSAKYFGEIHEQFDEVNWLRIELLVPANREQALQEYIRQAKMNDPEQVFFYRTDLPQVSINKNFHLPEEDYSRPNCVVLADSSGTVLHHYDLNEGVEMVRLVEHIAMLRPIEQKKEALFQREREM